MEIPGRTFVVNSIEGPHNRFKINVASTNRAKIPSTTTSTEIQMGCEYPTTPVQRYGNVLHVDVEDSLAEAMDKLDVVDALVAEVARVVVEASRRMVVGDIEELLERCAVVNIRSRM